ncbi:MAG TPA: hypothetical protein VI300_26895 [Solirubrobacter sp.]
MAWDPRGYLVCRRRCGGYVLAPTPGSGPTPCAFRCGALASWWCELCRAEVCRDHAIAREDGTFLCERCAEEARSAAEARERRVAAERRRRLAEAVAAVSACTDAHQLLAAVTAHVDQPIAEDCRDAWIRVVVGKVPPNHEFAHFAQRGLRRRWEETEPRHPAWLAAGLQGGPDMTLDAAGGLWLSPPAERLEGVEVTLVLRPSRPLELAGRGKEQHVTNARQRLRSGEPPVYARAVKAALEYALR